MRHFPSSCQYLVGALVLTLLATPTSAHKVEVAEDVGGTLHVEPNDTPRAGEKSLAWFALTRKGGQVIPLEQCNCQLAVYTSTAAPSSPPLLTPPMKAVSAERYQGIPGAEIQFPQPGIYQLRLSGTPTAGGNFKPFQLTFEVTVAVGTSSPAATPETTQPPRSSNQAAPLWRLPAIAVSVLLGLGILGAVWRQRK